MLHKTIIQTALTDPHRLALFVNGQGYDYQFMVSRALRLADWLAEQNIQRLGVGAHRCVNDYIGIMACVLTGRTYIPLNPKLPEDRLEIMCEEAGVDARLDDIPLDLTADYPITMPLAFAEENLAYIMFTSGSTGIPKGVPVSYANLNAFITSMQAHHQLHADDRVAQHADISFDMSVYDLFMAWNAGACLYVVPESQRLAPAHFIREHNISVWFSVPSVIGMLKKLKLLEENSLPSLRLSLFSGEALYTADALAWQRAAVNGFIDNLYGPTEATVECLAYRFDSAKDGANEADSVVTIGRALPGNLLAVVDEQMQWLGADVPGELLIAGPQVVSGYWQNPALNARKFIECDHAEYGKQRWYRTGDRVYKDAQGEYHYLGRIDNQVKIQGFRVELEEIEYHLKEVCGSDRVAAVVIKADNLSASDKLYAAVCDLHLDEQAIKSKLRSVIPFYMIPQRVVQVSQLPRNTNGKLDRQSLLRSLHEKSIF